MPFSKGDQVRIKGYPHGCAGFMIDEVQLFNGIECYSSAGRLWWPAEQLEFDLTEQQIVLAISLERAYHDFASAMRTVALAERNVHAEGLPSWMIKHIRDVANQELKPCRGGERGHHGDCAEGCPELEKLRSEE